MHYIQILHTRNSLIYLPKFAKYQLRWQYTLHWHYKNTIIRDLNIIIILWEGATTYLYPPNNETWLSFGNSFPRRINVYSHLQLLVSTVSYIQPCIKEQLGAAGYSEETAFIPILWIINSLMDLCAAKYTHCRHECTFTHTLVMYTRASLCSYTLTFCTIHKPIHCPT